MVELKDKFEKIKDEIVSEKGAVTLFMLLKMEDKEDRWSVALSAPWADADTHGSFDYLWKKLQKRLDENEKASLGTFMIIPSQAYAVDIYTEFKPGSILTDQVLKSGATVSSAIIVESNPALIHKN